MHDKRKESKGKQWWSEEERCGVPRVKYGDEWSVTSWPFSIHVQHKRLTGQELLDNPDLASASTAPSPHTSSMPLTIPPSRVLQPQLANPCWHWNCQSWLDTTVHIKANLTHFCHWRTKVLEPPTSICMPLSTFLCFHHIKNDCNNGRQVINDDQPKLLPRTSPQLKHSLLSFVIHPTTKNGTIHGLPWLLHHL